MLGDICDICGGVCMHMYMWSHMYVIHMWSMNACMEYMDHLCPKCIYGLLYYVHICAVCWHVRYIYMYVE